LPKRQTINREDCDRPVVAIFLVRYGETGLKGPPVRRRFEQVLSENIVRAHALAKVSCLVERERGRLFVTSSDTGASSIILSRTFGVVSHSLADECSSDPEAISKLAVSKLSGRMARGASFAVRARRSGIHTYNSMQLAALIGERILEAFSDRDIHVDLQKPDIEIFAEVRNNKAYVFEGAVPGPGGLPLRTQGKVLAVIDDEKSLLAAWLIMRRGSSTVLLNGSGLDEGVLERLKPWNPWWSGILKGISAADALKLKRCSGLVLGWDLEEFLSGTKPELDVPVFYPLIGLTKGEIEARMKAIFG